MQRPIIISASIKYGGMGFIELTQGFFYLKVNFKV